MLDTIFLSLFFWQFLLGGFYKKKETCRQNILVTMDITMTFDAVAYKILIFDINNDLSNRTKDTIVSWDQIMALKKMVTQKISRTHDGKWDFSGKNLSPSLSMAKMQ